MGYGRCLQNFHQNINQFISNLKNTPAVGTEVANCLLNLELIGNRICVRWSADRPRFSSAKLHHIHMN